MQSVSGVIWITGYSASGKTTVGRKVELILREKGVRTIILDGEDLRSIFSNRWGYTRAERIELAKIYFRLSSHLAAQGFTVVICAVAMYDDVRAWLRENVPGSIEVYLDVPEVERRRRDSLTKGIYAKNIMTEDLYDQPRSADITVQNYGAVDPDSAAKSVSEYFLSTGFARISDRGRTSYWNSYYQSSLAPLEASSFAQHVSSMLPSPRLEILEVGCGNGRDAIFFSGHGHRVTALDRSEGAISFCVHNHHASEIEFVTGTVSSLMKERELAFDVIYSRFCLHAMTLPEEEEFVTCAFDLLNADGSLFIECRSINDPLSRKGEVLSPTERIHGHYRRFIIPDELTMKLDHAGFNVTSMVESNGLAKYGDDDPVVLRLVARKS
jgi:adenylylsulfate kinase-like enzyme